jgi:predicted O-linked N-acetylglucosamine transferase (SPINDLY family)
VLVRVLLVVLALAGAGCLAVQERGARAADALTGAALSAPDAAALATNAQRERTARRLNPDTAPALDLAIVEARLGRNAQAARRILAVTRQEPENARAWTLLCSIARRYDSGLAATACARLREVVPPLGSLKRSSGRSTP